MLAPRAWKRTATPALKISVLSSAKAAEVHGMLVRVADEMGDILLHTLALCPTTLSPRVCP